MIRVCVFPKICVIHRQTDPVLAVLDMRASSLLLLTFIFTAAEYPLQIFGVNGKCEKPELQNNYGNIPDNINYEENSSFRMPCIEGFLRKAGTSNLFRCQKNKWNNVPKLACIADPRKPPSTPDSTKVANTQTHTTAPNPPLSTPSSTEKLYCTTMEKMDTSTTMNGQTSFTKTHTVATTAGTSQNTTLRTTTKEEEPMTTTNSDTLSLSSTLTDRENLTTVSSQSTSSSNTSTTIPIIKSSTNPSTIIKPSTNTSTTINTSTNTSATINTITGASGDNNRSHAITGGIAVGTVLLLIVVTGSAAGIFILCRRQDVSTAVERRQPPDLGYPLLEPAANPTSCPDSAQNPKSDPFIVVQQV